MKHFQIHVTNGNGKMTGIQSINTSTTNNEFCTKMRETDSVCKKCYAARFENMRPSLHDALEKNIVLSQRDLTTRELPIINASIFRFHSYGELINSKHFENYIAIANHNPGTIFTLWTKRKNIVSRVLNNMVKPGNLILIYSSSIIDDIAALPKHFNKVFTAHSKNTDKPINCHGECNNCRLCYSHNDVTFINEIVR